ANPAGTLTINMGGDSGALTVDALPDFTRSLTINGQTGTDTVTFQGTTSFTALTVNVTGAISDAAGTSLAVCGAATFNAGIAAITLGDNAADTTNFGSLTFAGGAISLSEDSSTLLAGANSVSSLSLASAGALTEAAGSSLTVANAAAFSGTSITLGSGTTDNFGSLQFNAAG